MRIGYLNINYFPPIIKSIIRRVRRVRYEYEYDEEEIKLGYKERLSAIESKIFEAVDSSDGIVQIANEYMRKGNVEDYYHH